MFRTCVTYRTRFDTSAGHWQNIISSSFQCAICSIRLSFYSFNDLFTIAFISIWLFHQECHNKCRYFILEISHISLNNEPWFWCGIEDANKLVNKSNGRLLFLLYPFGCHLSTSNYCNIFYYPFKCMPQIMIYNSCPLHWNIY